MLKMLNPKQSEKRFKGLPREFIRSVLRDSPRRMIRNLRNYIGHSRLITLLCQMALCITISFLTHDHLIGSCQQFTYALNVYLSILSAISLILRLNLFVFDQEPVSMNFHLMCVYATNVLMFASFVCSSSNTEDESGFSKLEAVAVLSAISWGVHLCHVASVTLLYVFHPDTSVFVQGTYEPLLDRADMTDMTDMTDTADTSYITDFPGARCPRDSRCDV